MDYKETLEKFRQQLLELDFKYRTMSPSDKEKNYNQYAEERKKIRHEMAMTMLDERNDKNDKHKRK